MKENDPFYLVIATVVNIASVAVLIWMFTGFEGRSGMQGMFDGMIPLLSGFALIGIGLVFNLIGIGKRERLNIILKWNIAYSFISAPTVILLMSS